VDGRVYFPYTEEERRLPKTHRDRLVRDLFLDPGPDRVGRLENPDLPPIFTIARLDRIKNLTGLVEAYGSNERLRELANLVVVASVIDPSRSRDAEEAAEIERMHRLISDLSLDGHIRWIGRILGNDEAGEAYRLMADRRGLFVQPALFEAFGLTILEAMHSGLPVMATQFGGPQEIIEHGRSGFLINPTVPEAMSARIVEFFENCLADPEHWNRFSESGLARARSRFTWDLHCRDLTRLTKVYGFWRYSISHEAKTRLNQYCHLLYQLFFQERASRI
jgi:sucrose synthase